jgi:hypothetical protein
LHRYLLKSSIKFGETAKGTLIMMQAIVTGDDLVKAIEPMIRRIVREELERIAEKRPGIFYLEPDMPVYQDMLEIKKRSKEKNLKFYSHKEVWGE